VKAYQSTVHYGRSLVINYVSEHQLLHAVIGSHTTSTTPMLLKLISGDIVCISSGFRTYLEQQPMFGAEPGPTAR